MSLGLCLVVVQGDMDRESPRESVRCLRSSPAGPLVSVLCHSRGSGDVGEMGDVGETGDVGDTGDIGDANCMSPSEPVVAPHDAKGYSCAACHYLTN
jgi:hypothetical protein